MPACGITRDTRLAESTIYPRIVIRSHGRQQPIAVHVATDQPQSLSRPLSLQKKAFLTSQTIPLAWRAEMGFRFRKSVRIAPGIRVNFSARGASVSAGPRGASLSFGSRGAYANVGIPGSGLSFRDRIDSASTQRHLAGHQAREARISAREASARHRAQALSQVALSLNADGTFSATNALGESLTSADRRLLWDQHATAVTAWLQEHIDEINGDVELLSGIHLDTPTPDCEPVYLRTPFGKPEPQRPDDPQVTTKPNPPQPLKPGWMARLFKSARAAHERRVAELDEQHQRDYQQWLTQEQGRARRYRAQFDEWEQAHREWTQGKEVHEARESERERIFSERIRSDAGFMEQVLGEALDALDWPRETLISYEIDPSRHTVWLDVDLPEIEDLPGREASLSANGQRLLIKQKAQSRLRQQYAEHVHGIALRIGGTVLATLPGVQRVVLSGYSQRLDQATGVTGDDYLYSVEFDRAGFTRIDFSALEKVDPVEALAAFNHRRKMSKTGVFKPIEPFSVERDAAG
jgi:hypothetical protein